jgi:hypothetical protein
MQDFCTPRAALPEFRGGTTRTERQPLQPLTSFVANSSQEGHARARGPAGHPRLRRGRARQGHPRSSDSHRTQGREMADHDRRPEARQPLRGRLRLDRPRPADPPSTIPARDTRATPASRRAPAQPCAFFRRSSLYAGCVFVGRRREISFLAAFLAFSSIQIFAGHGSAHSWVFWMAASGCLIFSTLGIREGVTRGWNSRTNSRRISATAYSAGMAFIACGALTAALLFVHQYH